MANKMNKFLYQDDTYVYINTAYAEAFILEEKIVDKSDRGSSIYYEYGDGFMALGVFPMKFYDDNDKLIAEKTLVYPNIIETKPSSNETRNDEVKGKAGRYRVLQYEKGDILMPLYSKQSFDNVNTFINMILSGNVPSTLWYDQVYKTWVHNIDINKLNPGVPDVMMQAVIAYVCRYKDELTTEFRKVYGNKGVDKNDYVFLSANEISSASSVLSSLAFERYVDKLATSITMSKKGTKQNISPVEKVITM